MSGAIWRYRVMTYVVGTGLLVLTLVGMPLQFAAGEPRVVAVVGPIHGFAYLVYLFAAYDVARRARFTLWQLVAMVAAGLLPFLAFVLERRVVRQLAARRDAGEVEHPKLVPRVALRRRDRIDATTGTAPAGGTGRRR